jgi:alkylhydroperoxidase family enzyme
MASRIRPLEEAEVSFSARPLYLASKRLFGRILTPLKVQARRPAIAWTSNMLGMAIERSGKIEARLRTLVQLRAAQLIECPF